MSRSRLLLLLLILLLGAVWYAWQNTPQQQKVGSANIAIKGKPESAVDRGETFSIVSLDVTGGEKLTYNEPKRDLFRPLYRSSVVKKTVASPKPSPVVVAPPPPPPPPPVIPNPAVRPAMGPKPIPPLKVLGFLQKGLETTVFLVSRQGDVYLVKKGDRFADGLFVRELDSATIVVSRGQNDQGITLYVSENKTSRMAIPNVSSGRSTAPAYKGPAPKAEMPEVDDE